MDGWWDDGPGTYPYREIFKAIQKKFKNCYCIVCREELLQSGNFMSWHRLPPNHHGSEYQLLLILLTHCNFSSHLSVPRPNGLISHYLHSFPPLPDQAFECPPPPPPYLTSNSLPSLRGHLEPQGWDGAEDGCREGRSTGWGQGKTGQHGAP